MKFADTQAAWRSRAHNGFALGELGALDGYELGEQLP